MMDTFAATEVIGIITRSTLGTDMTDWRVTSRAIAGEGGGGPRFGREIIFLSGIRSSDERWGDVYENADA